MKLDASVSKLPGVGPAYLKRLEKLNIYTIEDLLQHAPSRYVDFKSADNIKGISKSGNYTVKASLTSIKNQYTKSGKKIQFAQFEDDSGKIMTVWFNQPYLVRVLKRNVEYSLAGKVDWFGRQLSFISPEYKKSHQEGKNDSQNILPVYPETSGITSKWLRNKIFTAYSLVEDKLVEFLPEEILKKHELVEYKNAINAIHFPENLDIVKRARERLAFNELLIKHLKNEFRKEKRKEKKAAHVLEIENDVYKQFSSSLPFKLTDSQQRSVKEIFSDLSKKHPMNRLLQGDVGSGKTVVAAAAAFAVFENGYQTVFMAPTQILANQHHKTLKEIFDKFKVRMTLITSDETKKDPGKSDLIIGTHALIHKRVDFYNVGLVVIDEQHRFGVEQRAHLTKRAGDKHVSPHTLTMSATPIPRTVALTIFGDLDLSTLDELPKGRKPITTWVVPPKKRGSAYTWVKEQIIDSENQAYVICPLIEESDAEGMQQVKATTQEYRKLKKLFPRLNLGLLHGAQSTKERKSALNKFKKGQTDILVSTSVVEVGIDVPNATIMIIEGAERFGLAQLHQLRGRVGRGQEKSFCLLFTESRASEVQKRLNALKTTKSGFELAEIDLQMRGPGEIFGLRQHGFTQLQFANWQDSRLIVKTKKIAKAALSNRGEYSRLLDKLSPEHIAMN